MQDPPRHDRDDNSRLPPPYGCRAKRKEKALTTETGLKFTDTAVGTGASPKSGSRNCVMHTRLALRRGG